MTSIAVFIEIQFCCMFIEANMWRICSLKQYFHRHNSDLNNFRKLSIEHASKWSAPFQLIESFKSFNNSFLSSLIYFMNDRSLFLIERATHELNTLIPIAPPHNDTYIQLRCKQYSQTRGHQPITVHSIYSPSILPTRFVSYKWNTDNSESVNMIREQRTKNITHWMSKRDFTQISLFFTMFSYKIRKGWRRCCFVINVKLLHAEFVLEFRRNLYFYLDGNRYSI